MTKIDYKALRIILKTKGCNYKFENNQLYKKCLGCNKWYPCDFDSTTRVWSKFFGRNEGQSRKIATWCLVCSRARDIKNRKEQQEIDLQDMEKARNIKAKPLVGLQKLSPDKFVSALSKVFNGELKLV